MEIQDIRRLKLKLWFETRGIPKEEKSYISQLLSGKAPFRERAARRLEKDYGMGEYYLDSPADNELEEGPILPKSRNVPVVGSVQGGDNGYLLELEYPAGHGDGSIIFPAKSNSTYALRVRGDSMTPRIKNGEFVIVDPDYVVTPGDEVIVCLNNGRKMVKEYLYKRDDTITFGSINDGHGNITVEVSRIEKMHYVAAIIPNSYLFRASE